MKNNSGFTFLELVVSLFICSIILIVIIPNLINEYNALKKLEEDLVLKEILYEEIVNNKEDFSIQREKYNISVSNKKATIINLENGNKITYE